MDVRYGHDPIKASASANEKPWQGETTELQETAWSSNKIDIKYVY